MSGLEIAAAVAAVVIALGIFAIIQFKRLAIRSGEDRAKVEVSDEAFKAQTRRQKMARRTRARGRRLIERMQKWSRTGSS